MSEQLKIDVARLAGAGTRKTGTDGHATARAYLTKRLSDLGLEYYANSSYELTYKIENEVFTNVAGVLPGRERDLSPVLLIAHYDTCGDQPGADDNAAAIAIWLHVIEHAIKGQLLKRDLILFFPDAEEPPHFLTQFMGSTNFYQSQLQHKLHCGLVLDLVGHDLPVEGLEDLVFIFGAESHPHWDPIIRSVENPENLRTIATLNRYVGDLSDHHILRENNEPYLFMTCGRWEHYHSKSDVPEHLNYHKMSRLSQYLLDLLLKIDAAELGQYRPDFDPIQLEIDLLHQAIGPYLEERGIRLNDRNDVQKFVLAWVREFEL